MFDDIESVADEWIDLDASTDTNHERETPIGFFGLDNVVDLG